MENVSELQVRIPTDENGMAGRQCPDEKCRRYFKLKPGTGLPTDICHCPYCGTEGDAADFLTQDQMEYLKSIAAKHVLTPILEGFKQSVESLNRPSNNSLIEIKFSVDTPNFKIHSYYESDVETDVVCDSCGLEFGVFGVFASCPDCERLNVYSVFLKSLEVCRKKLLLLDLPETKSDKGLCEAILQDALSGAISTFDALGKKLRKEYGAIFPEKPRNLFQNLPSLNDCLIAHTQMGIEDRIGHSEWEDLIRLFQVRHIYEHNAGVMDEAFIKKVPSYDHMVGTKYPLDLSEIETLFHSLTVLVSSIEKSLSDL